MAREIWSNTSTMDYVMKLSPEEVRDFLINELDYDEEMVAELDDSELDDVLYDEGELFDNMDLEDLEMNILPELERQTEYSIAIELHDGEKRGMGGRVRTLDNLFNTDYDAIHRLMANDDGSLYILESSHDVPTGMMIELYTYPKDVDRFASECLRELVEEKLSLYEDNLDYTEQDAIDDTVLDLDYDPQEVIENYCDFSKVPEVCEPFKWSYDGANESLDEAERTEYKTAATANTRNMAQLEMEFNDLANKANVVFEDGDDDCKVKSLDYKNITKNYSFTEFCDNFPEFMMSIFRTFCTYALDDDDDSDDTKKSNKKFDILDATTSFAQEIWDGLDWRDWATMFNGARRLIKNKTSVQWKDIYKNYYDRYNP